MIPKTIHYCWFGKNEKTKLMKKCIDSWKTACPDYQIIEWNEDNFDIGMNPYTKACYENKKFAFLSDYVRLIIINENGGIYLDTDVEVIKPFDYLLKHEAYFGFETNEYVNTGLGFGAEANNPVVLQMISEYDDLLDGKHGVVGCPELNTRALVKAGLQKSGLYQELEHATVFPADFFNPYDDPTGRLNTTSNTYSIHWFGRSWMSTGKVLRSKLTKPLHRLQKRIKKSN